MGDWQRDTGEEEIKPCLSKAAVVRTFSPRQLSSQKRPEERLELLKVRLRVAETIAERLSEMHMLCRESEFVATHEFIGVSLLVVAEGDPPRATVHMIDF